MCWIPSIAEPCPDASTPDPIGPQASTSTLRERIRRTAIPKPNLSGPLLDAARAHKAIEVLDDLRPDQYGQYPSRAVLLLAIELVETIITRNPAGNLASILRTGAMAARQMVMGRLPELALKILMDEYLARAKECPLDTGSCLKAGNILIKIKDSFSRCGFLLFGTLIKEPKELGLSLAEAQPFYRRLADIVERMNGTRTDTYIPYAPRLRRHRPIKRGAAPSLEELKFQQELQKEAEHAIQGVDLRQSPADSIHPLVKLHIDLLESLLARAEEGRATYIALVMPPLARSITQGHIPASAMTAVIRAYHNQCAGMPYASMIELQAVGMLAHYENWGTVRPIDLFLPILRTPHELGLSCRISLRVYKRIIRIANLRL